MLNAFNDRLCSTLCWHNSPVPTSGRLSFPLSRVAKHMHEVEQQANNMLDQLETFYNTYIHPLADIHVGSTTAIQNPQMKLWDI